MGPSDSGDSASSVSFATLRIVLWDSRKILVDIGKPVYRIETQWEGVSGSIIATVYGLLQILSLPAACQFSRSGSPEPSDNPGRSYASLYRLILLLSLVCFMLRKKSSDCQCNAGKGRWYLCPPFRLHIINVVKHHLERRPRYPTSNLP